MAGPRLWFDDAPHQKGHIAYGRLANPHGLIRAGIGDYQQLDSCTGGNIQVRNTFQRLAKKLRAIMRWDNNADMYWRSIIHGHDFTGAGIVCHCG